MAYVPGESDSLLSADELTSQTYNAPEITNDKVTKMDETRKMTISRQVYTQEALEREYATEEESGPTCSNRLRKSCQCNKRKLWKTVAYYLPVIKFARYYKFREYLLGDFLSGLTVSFMHLPQAMGFGILASLRPVHGLYSSFFPVLFYLIFGSSPYISFGTNAVMALLTKTVVEREGDKFVASFQGNASMGPTEEEILAVKVSTAAACSFLAGIFLTGLGLLRLGFITTYLSTSFVGGFTTAAAIHIASSQIPKMFGIKVQSFSGAGKLVRMYIDLFSNIEQTKVAELTITIICIIVLLLVKICINERFNKKMKMPIPIDLIVVVVGTIISHFAKFNEEFGVKIVGSIPSGFATPAAPRLIHADSFIADAFVMAILSLAMSISMAKLTAKKHDIVLNDNQELVGYGVSNLMSGFFSCFPSATAPPRTMILSSLGAKTTLNGIATAVFMLLVILLIGPLFTSLPLSVLAAMIIVSMKELLLQYRNLPRIWRINRYDFIIWLVTNLVSVFGDLDYGVIAGIGVSIFLIVVQNQISKSYLIGFSKSEDVLLNLKQSRNVEQLRGVKIFKFTTSLYFATAERFKAQIFAEVVNPQKFKKQQAKKEAARESDLNSASAINGSNGGTDKYLETVESKVIQIVPSDDDIKSVVIECSSMTYMDMAGSGMLEQVIKQYKGINKAVYLAGLPEKPRSVLEASGFFDNFPRQSVFVDVFDAIAMLKKESMDSRL